jgi:hypothetical protein
MKVPCAHCLIIYHSFVTNPPPPPTFGNSWSTKIFMRCQSYIMASMFMSRLGRIVMYSMRPTPAPAPTTAATAPAPPPSLFSLLHSILITVLRVKWGVSKPMCTTSKMFITPQMQMTTMFPPMRNFWEACGGNASRTKRPQSKSKKPTKRTQCQLRQAPKNRRGSMANPQRPVKDKLQDNDVDKCMPC